MKRLVPLTLALTALTFAGCASGTKARTLETEDGKSAVIGAAESESEATIAALDEAKSHCAQQNLRPVFDDRVLKPAKNNDSPVNLSKLPVIGAVFKDQGKTRVTLQFKCS